MASRTATPTRSRTTAKAKAPARARTTSPAATKAKAAPTRARATSAKPNSGHGEGDRIMVRLPMATGAAVRREAKAAGKSITGWAAEVLADAVVGRKPMAADMGARRTATAGGARAGSKGPTRGGRPTAKR